MKKTDVIDLLLIVALSASIFVSAGQWWALQYNIRKDQQEQLKPKP